jgi:hypothetical protein
VAPKRVKPLDKVLLDAATANLSEPRGQQLIFDYYKRVGYLPPKDAQGHTFKSLQEYLSAVQRLANQERSINPDANPNEWLRAAEARLGFNRQIRSAKTGKELSIVASRQLEDPKQKLAKNRVGSVFPLEIGEDGNVRFNKRKYMSAEGGLPRPVYDFIESKHGTEVANTYQKSVRKEWKDMGDAGRKLAAETGIPFDRGHWLSNKYGGAESARAGALEIAKLNRLHGAAPRGNIEAIRETGRTSFGWLDDFYQWDLTNNKLNVLGSEHLKDADLQAISSGLDPNKIIAQRVGEWEARGRTPDPDSVGFIFGSQLDRDETIRQQQLRMMEEQLASISKTGIDPQTGNPVSPERLDELQKGARAAKKSTKLMPGGAALKTLGKAASVLPGVGAVLDVGDVFAGTQQAMTSSSRQQQTTGALRSASGALGLASLAAPVLAPAALAVSGVSALAERRAAMPKPAQVDQIIPTPKPVMANTPTGVAQLKAMPKSKPLNLVNEAQYFIVNPIRSAYDRIFGKRDI